MTFRDGPAAGKADGLMVRRAPPYLRVAVSPHGNWDALDQLADTPRPRETVYAYRRVGRVTWFYVRPGGRFAAAEYRVVEPQPDAATLRETAKWRQWCREQQASGKGAETQ